MSGEESDDSDFDTDEMLKELEGMKELLHRHVGKHKNVARLQGADMGHWPEVYTIEASVLAEDEADLTHTIKLVNDAEDTERKRRMSVPFTETLTDDIDLEEMSEHVTSMHEELLHLFSIHDAKFQAECEKERRTTESTKQRMQEQLLKKANMRRARQEFEVEKLRRIEEMESFLIGADTEQTMALAEANEKLSLVHEDLKHAFRIMEKAKEVQESNQVRSTEESKEMLLQEIRRRSTKKQHGKDFELARQQKIDDYNARVTPEAEDLDRSLVQVQEDLLKLFGKLKKDRTVKKEETRVEQSNCKTVMQEELLHKTLAKQVSKLEAHEKARRITEAKSGATEEDSKRQKTMDMLIDVQKQLLDVMSQTELMSAKQQMHQLKFMNSRSNMLHEIRMHGSGHDI
ncbi:hypothetical protein QZH41_011005, partial [Actinostola sp. cb2023]